MAKKKRIEAAQYYKLNKQLNNTFYNVSKQICNGIYNPIMIEPTCIKQQADIHYKSKHSTAKHANIENIKK